MAENLGGIKGQFGAVQLKYNLIPHTQNEL